MVLCVLDAMLKMDVAWSAMAFACLSTANAWEVPIQRD
jgi:hypothetical protein